MLIDIILWSIWPIIGLISGAILGGMTCDRTRVFCKDKSCSLNRGTCTRKIIYVPTCIDCLDPALICPDCGEEKQWVECSYCDEYGCSSHDCGEDTCNCLNPENNVNCDACGGDSGSLFCPICSPGAFE